LLRASTFLVLMVLVTGCVASDVEPASTAPPPASVFAPIAGALDVATVPYDFGLMVATAPEIPEPALVRIRGEAYVPDGDGPYPLVLLMHGNHFTCTTPLGRTGGLAPCVDTPLTVSEPSFEGYRTLGKDLAARGFVVASINANDVNDANGGHDLGAQQRAQLFLRTLDEIAASQIGAKVDVERVGLMGHSRGGDGAARAVTLDAGAHGIDALFALAPSDFTRHLVTGVAFATLLPYCDGDMYDLEGAWMYDDARYLDGAGPLHQIVAMGANHNFYNSVWTGDDADWGEPDAECEPDSVHRSTVEEQDLGGVLYMGAFFRRYLADEVALDGFLRGDAIAPREACAASRAGCAAAFHVSYHPPADARLLIEDGDGDDLGATNDAGGATTIAGFTTFETCKPEAWDQTRLSTLEGPLLMAPPNEKGTCPYEQTTSTAPQITAAWKGPASARWDLPADRQDVRAFEALNVRVGVEPGQAAPPAMRVTLLGADGSRASVDATAISSALFLPPGEIDDIVKVTLNSVRIPLSSFAGVDLASVAAVELSFEGEGALRIADAMLQG